MEKGSKVLIIDMDGQMANITYLAGVKTDSKTKTMEDILIKDEDPKECILSVVKNTGKIDMIPATVQMAALSSTAKISKMKKAVKILKNDYDYIFLDVNPSPDWRHALSLSVLDGVCIVMLPDILSLEANRGIFDSIEEVQEGVNTDLKITGLILNQFDNRTKLARAVTDKAQQMAEYCGSVLFDSTVRKAVAMSESAAAHEGVTKYAPRSAVADDVRRLTDEIIKKL